MRVLDLGDPGILDHSMVVSASAGSGKTFTLTVLVAAGLGRGDLRAYEILATTFSEAAAADLRVRLLRPLELLAILDEAAWREALPLLGQRGGEALEALLRRLPLSDRLRKSAKEVALAAGHWGAVDWAGSPARARAFWRRTRREAELLQVSTIHSLSLRLLGRGEGAPEAIRDVAHPALLRLLRQTLREALTLPATDPDQVPARLLLEWAERNWEALSRGYDNHRDALGHLQPEDAAPLRQRLREALAQAEAALAPFAADPASAQDPASPSRRYFSPDCLLPIPGPGAELAVRLRWAERQSRRVDAEKKYFNAGFREAMAAFGPVADALEAWLRALLVGALRRFEEGKAEFGYATFGDLVRRALQSLREGAVEPPAPKLLLVDEYQDTSPSQDAFLAALGAARIVRVGDVKQAIYGFRGGDPGLLREHLKAAGDHAFRLPLNFRSTPQVVALANRFVEEIWPQLDPDLGELDGAQEAAGPGAAPVGLVRTSTSTAWADLPALSDWIAGLSRDAGWRQCLGEASTTERRRRALLLKQRTRLPALLRRLKARGIQPYVVSQTGFWDSPGVRLVMAALESVAHLERPRPCATLLRHFAGMSDAEITGLADSEEGRPRLPGLGDLDPERLPGAVRWLLDLRQASAQELAGRILEQGALLRSLAALRVHGAMEPLRARRNLGALLAMLLELPASPAVAFALLEDERDGMERGDLPAAAEQADLLVQTVHASKGLEYDDVILPLLHSSPRHFQRGQLRTRPGTAELLLAWKLGDHEGRAFRELKPIVEARQRRDELNLLYVALTRAQERLCLLLQEPQSRKAPAEARTWAQFGQHLVDAHPELELLRDPPSPEPVVEAAPDRVDAPPTRTALTVRGASAGMHPDAPAETQAKARQEGEAVHAFLRDLLVRWEDPAAFARCLDAAPPVPRVRENALRFLQQFEARGWRSLRRRTELPLAGAAASGALGRADLVVWDGDRIQLLDFKHSKGFGEEELALYRQQLARYAEVLTAREGKTVEAWLVALRSGEWVRV